ncbi:MAG: hypothetical protein K6A63_04680 [Acholeplasmatales bacterium]|nr:hypothetical protein [Acholeplasmatales bacterium]
MKVENVVNSQKVIYNILKQAKVNNRLSHAYLFYGEAGTGKKEMAMALACMLYCEHGGCFKCDTCRTILDGNHMNVDYIGMEANKTKISKDQIMDLQEEFSKTSLVEGTRVYIVDGIDTASTQAQNSLLKFIEDPANTTPTIGIFLATELSNVVSTIQSRCVLLHFEAIEQKNMIDILIDQGIDDLDARLISCLTNDPDSAEEISQNENYQAIKGMFLELVDVKNKSEAVKYYLENAMYFSIPGVGTDNLTMLLKWVLAFFSDANKDKKADTDLILSPLYDKIKVYKSNSRALMTEKLEMVLFLFKELKSNVSPKNVFFELMEKFI